ncbi:MAG: RimK family alpha-L-glutamate ligase [Pseudomonadota bacterium]
MPTPHIVLFSEDVGDEWHSGALIQAFEKQGARVTRVALANCGFDTRSPGGLTIPGFDDRLPDGAFVRAISTGSLEQITVRLGILHALQHAGVLVWNSADAIERCVDKAMALQCFHRGGLPVPTSLTTETLANAQAFTSQSGNDTGVVLKPLFGSQGNGIRRIAPNDILPPEDDVGAVYHLQHYLPPPEGGPFSDLRLLVSGHRVLAAMQRQSDTWPTNVHQGGAPTVLEITDDLADLAVRAAQAVGANYAGVDIMMDAHANPHLIEINSNPAWKGVQSVTGWDIAEQLVADFLNRQRQASIETAFTSACASELTAIKPGNVHIFADGHRMRVEHFAKSALAAGPHIADPDRSVGGRIKASVAATVAAVDCNTNLGICLLCAPLAKAAEAQTAGEKSAGDKSTQGEASKARPQTADGLRKRLDLVLTELTIADAKNAYAAIRLASPAGLGRAASQDINAAPRVTLREVMALSADRDRIGKAYTDTFEDIFAHGLPTYTEALARTDDPSVAVSYLHMVFLSRFPDSHITRKHGSEAANHVMTEARSLLGANPSQLLAFDADLKHRGLNPGTTADFVVATVFAHELISPTSRACGHVYACLKS